MTILKFVEQSPEEKSCWDHVKEITERERVVCKKCNLKKPYGNLMPIPQLLTV